MEKGMRIIICAVFVLTILIIPNRSLSVRIKDLAYICGMRPNQLIGYGLVVGLNGTGDKSSTIFTNQSLSNMLERMGIKVNPNDTKVNNVASVVVTATLPPFAKPSQKS